MVERWGLGRRRERLRRSRADERLRRDRETESLAGGAVPVRAGLLPLNQSASMTRPARSMIALDDDDARRRSTRSAAFGLAVGLAGACRFAELGAGGHGLGGCWLARLAAPASLSGKRRPPPNTT